LSVRRRPCSSVASSPVCAARNVDTSIVSDPECTCTRRNLRPDDEGAAKQGLHVLRPGIGRNVEILRLDAEQEVAHRAADDERLEPGFVQPPGDVERAAGKLLTADRMVAGAVDARLPLLFAAGQKAGKEAAGSSRAHRRRAVA
jgi:hypothetical protein